MWIVLSLVAGLGDALRDAFSKRAALTIPRPLITWSYSLLALPFFLPTLVRHMPDSLPSWFWPILLTMSSAHVLGGLFLVRALKLSDLSLCTPMMAFTPVFLLALGPWITGDSLSIQGVLGAILVAIGSYVLNLGRSQEGLSAPLRALFTERGSRIMLGLALLWSITGSIDRKVVQHVDPAFWGSSIVCCISVLLIPFVFQTGGFSRHHYSFRSIATLVALGGCNALSILTYLVALQIAPVHFVICLKRSSILFSVLLGRALFRESLLADRLPGAILMLLGVVTISLS
jgi:drug/metabolite transporter (DMT)-like permease